MATSNRKSSLRGLRTFCVAAQHTSFRSAADELFVTASAVSHQVRNLEEEFDLQLFDRSGRSLQLTADGQALYDDVSPLIAQLDEVTTRHRNLRPRDILRISVQPFFASELFVPRLPDFRRQHPDIEIKVDTSDESSEKHPAGSDVSIRVFSSPPDSMPSDRLFALRLVPAASAEFRDKVKLQGRRIRGDFPVIVHESRPRAWLDWQKKSGISVPTGSASLRLDSMIAVARAAERGLGAALVPSQLSDSWFDTGALVKLFPEELPTDDAYYLVCRKEDEGNENVQLLRSWVLSQFGGI
ncbi:MAG: LysR substrate-binding domain-containing protein [Woeseiaceae bacterium]|jgi:LysR family glycine cleavage system transcriptional activator